MVFTCIGWGCHRLISVSQIPGGNPTAVRDPDHFSIKFAICEDCKAYYCDRCLAKKRRLLRAPRCHRCRGSLLDGKRREQALGRPWPEAVIRFNEGCKLQRAGQTGEALAVLDQVLGLRPEYVSAHFHRGIVLRQLGRHTDALAAFEEVVRLDPDDAQALFDKAGVYCELRRWEDALRAYDQATSVEPNYLAAHINKALTLNNLGRHAQALVACEMAIRIYEANQEADETHHLQHYLYAGKGTTLLHLGRYDEALTAIEVAIRSGPDDPNIYSNLGLALTKLGRHEEARLAYRIREESRNRK